MSRTYKEQTTSDTEPAPKNFTHKQERKRVKNNLKFFMDSEYRLATHNPHEVPQTCLLDEQV